MKRGFILDQFVYRNTNPKKYAVYKLWKFPKVKAENLMKHARSWKKILKKKSGQDRTLNLKSTISFRESFRPAARTLEIRYFDSRQKTNRSKM